MKHIKLVARTDRETGELGLMIRGMKQIDYPMVANDGRLIAHDLLEHQRGVESIGSVGDELIALGGVWYIRGQLDDIRRDGIGSRYNAYEHLAADVVNLGRLYLEDIPYRVAVPKTRAHTCDQDFLNIREYARGDLPTEINWNENTINIEEIEQYLDDVMHFLRRGYNMARTRFKCQYRANDQFWAIADAVEPYTKPDFEGQTFLLSYGNGEARCTEVYEDNY